MTDRHSHPLSATSIAACCSERPPLCPAVDRPCLPTVYVRVDARLGTSQASRAGAAAPSSTTTSGIVLLFVVAWQH